MPPSDPNPNQAPASTPATANPPFPQPPAPTNPEPIAAVPTSSTTGVNLDPGRPERSHRLAAIFISLGAVIVLAAGYFLVAPAILASRYSNASSSVKAAITEPVNKSIDTFRLPIFSSSESTASGDEANLKTTSDAIAAARSAITSNEAKFVKWSLLPGMSLSPLSAAARKEHDANSAYLTTAKAFLDNLNDLTTYSQKILPLEQKMEAIGNQINAAGTDLNKAAAAMKTAAVGIDSLVAQLKTVTPPSFVKDSQNEIITDYTKFAASMRQLSSAISAKNVTAIQTAAADMDKTASHVKTSQDSYVDKLQNHSTISGEISDLKAFK